MNAAHLRIVPVLLTIFCCGTSWAQAPMSGGFAPISKPGGYASQELANIYQQSVGGAHTSASLNAGVLSSARSGVPQAPRPQAPGGPRIGLGIGATAAGKPFSSFTPPPTVSPYLNLFREDLSGGSDLNYNTLVRPMLQQQEFNQQVQRQNMDIARRLQAISAQADFNPRGSESQLPTGHQTVYRYYGHYYPALNARFRR